MGKPPWRFALGKLTAADRRVRHSYLHFQQQGAFAPENLTTEALGNDPTSGDPEKVVQAAFYEGFPNGTLAGNNSALWMVEQVRKYPNEVVIFSGGALTNIALAVRLDPEFASLAKRLVIMGGYLDVTLLQTSGSVLQADLSSDVSFGVILGYIQNKGHRTSRRYSSLTVSHRLTSRLIQREPKLL